MAHLEVAAGSGGVLAGSVRAADLFDLLAQALQGAVHLQVAVTENVCVISTEQTEGIGGLLLWLGDEAEVETATRGTWCSRGSRKSRRTLKDTRGEGRKGRSYFFVDIGLAEFLKHHNLYMMNK